MNHLVPGETRWMCWKGVKLGANESMCGFQPGYSNRLTEGVLRSRGNGLDKKKEASSATRMYVNTLFHISAFVPSFSKEESTMEGQRAELETMRPKKKCLKPEGSTGSDWDNIEEKKQHKKTIQFSG